MATYFYGQSSKDLKWYFRLKDNNNETILASTEGYNSKQGCLNGIDSVKKHSPHEPYYKSFVGQDLKYYFSLHAANGEKIGKSEAYNSSQGRDKGKENCKREAPFASVKEIIGSFA
jgi:uncharacterized protein YegP (UPF0339 family)